MGFITVGYRSGQLTSGCATETVLMVRSCPEYQELSKVYVRCHILLCLGRNWQTTRFMEVEVAVRLLYMLAEALPVSHGAHFSGDVSKASALQDMMRTVGTPRVLYCDVMCSVCCVVGSWVLNR